MSSPFMFYGLPVMLLLLYSSLNTVYKVHMPKRSYVVIPKEQGEGQEGNTCLLDTSDENHFVNSVFKG